MLSESDVNDVVAPTFAADIDTEGREIVQQLLGEFLDPEVLRRTAVSILAGGAINRSFLVEGPGLKSVLRIAPGPSDIEDVGIDMANSVVVAQITGAAGVGPGVLGFKAPEGHSLIEFVPGVLNNMTLREGTRLHDVGVCVRELHSLPTDGVRELSTFTEIADWLARATAQNSEIGQQFEQLRPQLEQVEAVIEGVEGRCLSHRDLNPQNCIHRGDRAVLIDWDFSGVDSPYLDLAMLTTYADLEPQEAEMFWAGAIGDVTEADVARIKLMSFAHAVRDWAWARMARAALIGKTATDDDLLPAGAEAADDFYIAFGDVNWAAAQRFAADPQFGEWLRVAASDLPAPGFR